MRLTLSILLLLAGAQAALAGIESCEKIKDADAYNACLATYGPAVKEHGGKQAPPSDDEPQAQEPGSKEPQTRQLAPSEEPARGGRRHHGRGARHVSRQETRSAHRTRGRVRMELMVPSRR